MSGSTQNKDWELAEQEEGQIRNHIHDQIRGVSDQRRSKEIWLRILSLASQECIANALSEQLSHFNYQEVAYIRTGN
ncbi:hypothetical protein [Janthinobacterium sp. EB271-G4-7A]|uniref:hypothetical protein n=1 Tax=Janthinobacterium sp. EB271-G4-7A TaxID=2775056 RepID=UPI001E4D0917|nr:hypothetical protein [Janthinobacterium sp. EB271-G4-7A]MCC7695110.1 hypothetical protein [Janthinobacterium sp. EB271-G4-7A]